MDRSQKWQIDYSLRVESVEKKSSEFARIIETPLEIESSKRAGGL